MSWEKFRLGGPIHQGDLGKLYRDLIKIQYPHFKDFEKSDLTDPDKKSPDQADSEL